MGNQTPTKEEVEDFMRQNWNKVSESDKELLLQMVWFVLKKVMLLSLGFEPTKKYHISYGYDPNKKWKNKKKRKAIDTIR